MIYSLLTLIALALAFMLWFLAALIRESRRLRPPMANAARPRGGPVSRRGELMFMNAATVREKKKAKTIGKRTILMVLGALLFTPTLRGQQPVSDASGTAVPEGTSSGQPIPPAVMKELEAMKTRIAQLEAQLQKRDGQQGTGNRGRVPLWKELQKDRRGRMLRGSI
jgi:hypothetical protein